MNEETNIVNEAEDMSENDISNRNDENDENIENNENNESQINDEAKMLAYKSRQKKIRMCALAGVVLSALSVALRVLSLFFFYEKDIAYYERGAILPMLSHLVYALAVIFFAASAFWLIPKAREVDGANVPHPSFVCRLAALLPAAALIYYAVSSYMKNGEGKLGGLPLLTVIFSVLAAIFFILLSLKQKTPHFTAGMGLTFVLWAAFVWIDSYIDYTVPLNSPDKLYFHFGCIAAAFFIINEIRALISCTRPREMYFSVMFALLALFTSAFPSIAAYSQDVFLRYPAFDADIVLLAVFIYALLRLSDVLPRLLSKPTAYEETGDKEEDPELGEMAEAAEEYDTFEESEAMAESNETEEISKESKE